MVTLQDIFFRIAQHLRGYSGADQMAAISEFLNGTAFDIHLAMTTEVADTERDYAARYGAGHIFHFPVANYFQGKELISDIYYQLRGVRPNMFTHTGVRFKAGEDLFLFIHLREVQVVPAKLQLEMGERGFHFVEVHAAFPKRPDEPAAPEITSLRAG